MASTLERMQKSDSALVYFFAKEEQAVYEAVTQMVLENPDFFREKIPLFAGQVLDSQGRAVPGLAFGQEPNAEESSFGNERGRLAMTFANREIRRRLSAGEKLTIEDAYKLMAFYLNKFDVDLETPAFNKNGRPLFPTIAGHIDQTPR